MQVRFLDTRTDWQNLGQHRRLKRTMNYLVAKADCCVLKRTKLFIFLLGSIQQLLAKKMLILVFFFFMRQE